MTVPKTAYDRLLEVLVEVGLEPSEISSEAVLRADLGVDSAELVEIATKLAPGKADGKALKSVVTVADLADFVENRA
ncbi:acyl carrier protein [Actinomadura sp. 3N508]|uniref:acyl carrier protein n=1 Tax=Actinomadura sp. 3N508 TaxID=3375153 RepID=UPI0037AF4E9A